MNTNPKFGTLEDGTIVYSPTALRVKHTMEKEGRTIEWYTTELHPTEADYLTMEYKRLHLAQPTEPAPEGSHYEADGYTETDTDITRNWKTVQNPTIYRAWTPLTIMRGAKAGSFWTAIKAVLEANDALDEFMASQYCAECDPSFVAIRAIIVGQIGEAETAAFLDSLKVERTGTQEQLLSMGV